MLPVYIQYRWKCEVSKLWNRGTNPAVDDHVHFVQSAGREVIDPMFRDLGMPSMSKEVNQRHVSKKNGLPQPYISFKKKCTERQMMCSLSIERMPNQI